MFDIFFFGNIARPWMVYTLGEAFAEKNIPFMGKTPYWSKHIMSFSCVSAEGLQLYICIFTPDLFLICLQHTFVVGQYPSCISLSQLLHDNRTPYYGHVAMDIVRDTAILLYSSGTTGLPKGTMITHHAVVANLKQFG